MFKRFISIVALLGVNPSALAQTAPPAAIGEIVRIDPNVPFRGWSFVGYECKENFSVCGHVVRKGTTYYVVKTQPINYRIGSPVTRERVAGLSRFSASPGETTGWNCYIDEQRPSLVFLARNRRSVRAIVRDRSDNYVEVARTLGGSNWCELETD